MYEWMGQPYSDREVARSVARGGLIVSTIFAADVDQYETAIVDEFTTVIVQRYDYLLEAQKAHSFWTRISHSGMTVQPLDIYDEITLVGRRAW